MKLVYVAGPYTTPDPCINTHEAIRVGNEVWDAGMTPFIPHLCHFWHTVTPKPYEVWLEIDMEFVRRADAVLRMPGKSSGADGEVAEAERLGIPVFYTLDELVAWHQSQT